MKYLSHMDVVAVPSRFEGFGLSAVEAMGSGKPVVASRVGGLEEVVCEGETGLLVPHEDPDALAVALGRILTDETLCLSMGRAGRRKVAARYDFPVFRERCRMLYARLI
jgi:glycosyltransferase involved in cell wall biosynthesis